LLLNPAPLLKPAWRSILFRSSPSPYKHSERHPGERTCSITDASTRPGGAVVTFTWTDAQGGSHREDCLDLAERAVNAWSAFIRIHSL
jgi:hypothetical protein